MRTGDARADAPSGAGRCAAGRHKDKALASLSERLKGSACGRGRGGLPTGQGRGIAPLCGVGMNPHFLFGCAEKKTAVHGQKKRRFRVQILPMRAGLDKYGGRASRCPRKPRVPYRVRYPLGEQRGCCPAFGGVGAAFGVVIKGLYHWPRAYLRLRAALTGGWLRYAPAGAAASLCATVPKPREGNPGPACLRGVCRRHFLWASAKGGAAAPSLRVVWGVWGRVETPPRFWRGCKGEGSLRQRPLPLPPSPAGPPGHQGSSLQRGILIHRGPPRPRDSSALGMVWMRIPASSSARLVT